MPDHKNITEAIRERSLLHSLSDKTVARMLRIFFYIAFLGTLFWTLQRMSLFSQIGTEDVYWERARFLLGYSDVSLYNGSSLCSLGYSLLLAPILALAGSSQAAYKAALILNMFFVALSYRVAVGASKKLFPKEKESFLCIACFFAVMCPAFAYTRTCLTPDMAVLLLTWCSIYLLAALWESCRIRDLVLLAVCLIIIGFMQIMAIGVIAAAVIMLFFYVRHKKIKENAFWTFLFAVLLGIAADNAAEQIFLNAFASEMNLSSINTSLEVMVKSIGAVTIPAYIVSFFTSFMGKLCSVLTASFMLICPALWVFFRNLFRKKEGSDKDLQTQNETDGIPWELSVCGIAGIFFIQFVWICLYGCSLDMGERILSLSGLYMVISPLILAGIVAFKKKAQNDCEKELIGYLVLLCISTFFAVGALNTVEDSVIENYYGGFLIIFRGVNSAALNASTAVFIGAFFAGLLAVLFFTLLSTTTGKKTPEYAVHGGGYVMLLGVFALVNIMVVNWSVRMDSLTYLDKIDSITNLISESGTVSDCIYINENEGDDLLPVLQFLLPELNIHEMQIDAAVQIDMDELNSADYDPDNLVILTDVNGTDNTSIYESYEEILNGWDVQYFSRSYAIWAKSGSQTETAMEQGTENLIRAVPLNESKMEEYETEDEEGEDQEEDVNAADASENGEAEDGEAEDGDSDVIVSETGSDLSETEDEVNATWKTLKYGGVSFNLEPGTWRIEVPMHTDSDEALAGMLTVLADDSEISTVSFDESIFDANGNATAYIEFTSPSMLINVTIQLEGTLVAESTVGTLNCWKLESADMSAAAENTEQYSYGEDADFSELLQIVEQLEEGTILYAVQDYSLIRNKSVSYTDFQEQIPEYTVSEISYYTAKTMTGDAILLTYGISEDCLSLLEQYSILGHAGRYTLWAKTDGEYLSALTANGLGSLSSGMKISSASVAAMTGITSEENEVVGLPAGQYRLYLQLTSADLEPDTTVQVTVWRNKTESELENEVEKWVEKGYSEEEAIKQIKTSVQYAEETFSCSGCSQNDDMLVSTLVSYSTNMENMYCIATSSLNEDVEVEILWIAVVN